MSEHEKSYAVEDVFRQKIIQVPEGQLRFYRDQIDTITGKNQFEFLEDVNGYQRLGDGTIKSIMIPAKNVRDTANEKTSFLLPEPAFKKVAKDNVRYRKMRQIAKDDPAMNTYIRSITSAATFGASTTALDSIHGEEYEEIRAMTVQEHGFAHGFGRATTLVGASLIPIPGLAPAMRALPMFKGAVNVGSLTEVGAAVSSMVRGAIPGKGLVSEFVRRGTGAVAFGGVVEAPLSVMMASADIVDNNRDYTLDAVMSESVMQYGMAMGIASITSIPFAAIGAIAAVTTRKGLQVANEFLEAEAQMVAKASDKSPAAMSGIMDSLIKGGIRNFSRRRLRGVGFGIGDAVETHLYKMAHRYTHGKGGGRVLAENKWVRFLAGEESVDFIRRQQKVGQAINRLAKAESPNAIKEAAEVLMFNADREGRHMTELAFIRDNANDIVSARRVTKSLVSDADRFAEMAQNVEFRHPVQVDKLVGKETWFNDIKSGLDVAGLDGEAILKGKNAFEGLDAALNARRTAPMAKRRVLDDAIEAHWPTMKEKKYLKNFDEFDRAANETRLMASQYEDDLSGIQALLIGDGRTTSVTGFRANTQSIHGNFRELTNPKVNAIKDANPFFAGDNPIFTRKGEETIFNVGTHLDDLENGLNGLGSINTVTKNLREVDASPLLKAPIPKTQEERLRAQLETVMDHKKRIKEAIYFAASKGGGARHTATFGGVYMFRQGISAAQKKQAFALYSEAITQHAASPEALQEIVGRTVAPLAAEDMEMGVGLAGTLATGYAYLNQQLPRSSDPRIQPEDFSMAEIENFLEAAGALLDMPSVIATASDGSVTNQAVDAIRTVYPELYIDAVLDVAEFVDEWGHKLSHETLIGFDTFTGGALGYSDGPAPDLTMQPPYAQTQGQAQAIGGPENRRMNIQQNATPAQKLAAF